MLLSLTNLDVHLANSSQVVASLSPIASSVVLSTHQHGIARAKQPCISKDHSRDTLNSCGVVTRYAMHVLRGRIATVQTVHCTRHDCALT